jgi:hypothetical protein
VSWLVSSFALPSDAVHLLRKRRAAVPSLVLAQLSHATKLFFLGRFLPVTRLIELAIQPDQVHLCVRTLPSTLPSDIPRLIKGRSSRLVRQEFVHARRLPVLWSPSSFLSTAGNLSSETIAHYMQQQSEHEEVPAFHPCPR